MDYTCVQCGEPWDVDYVRHEMDEAERKSLLSGQGCPSCVGAEIDAGKAQIMGEALLFFGDDLDALASSMDDGDFNFLLGG